MARQPPELTEQQRMLGRHLAALREAAGLYQTDIARAVPCHRTTVTHAEAGSQLPDAHFWETADQVVGANGALIARYDTLIQAKQAHTANQQAQRRARAQATAQQLHTTPPPKSFGASSALDSGAANAALGQLEILRRSLNETITDYTTTVAGLDEWERTVLQHGQTTRDRAPSVLLKDLSADLVELRGALARCRSSSALRRLTKVTAQMVNIQL
jgi:DNA-binding XRE family transcriptional regulator